MFGSCKERAGSRKHKEEGLQLKEKEAAERKNNRSAIVFGHRSF